MNHGLVVIAFFVLCTSWAYAETTSVPLCRLDDTMKGEITETIIRAAKAFADNGKPLPFDTIVVNPRTKPAGAKVLSVFVVSDASANEVTAQGCTKGPTKKEGALDAHSIRGGCFVAAVDYLEMRCSAEAVKIFGARANSSRQPNPALLYVLSHELAHIYQRRSGEYSGRLQPIALNRDVKAKVRDLRDSCDPVATRKEADADAMALEVLSKLLVLQPYREPIFSERGSLYWNIDRLALASDTWQRAAMEREFISQGKPHASFVPTLFPMPKETITKNAKRFVCEVLTRPQGTILYPARAESHPPVEQRLRNITEALQPIANRLPARRT